MARIIYFLIALVFCTYSCSKEGENIKLDGQWRDIETHSLIRSFSTGLDSTVYVDSLLVNFSSEGDFWVENQNAPVLGTLFTKGTFLHDEALNEIRFTEVTDFPISNFDEDLSSEQYWIIDELTESKLEVTAHYKQTNANGLLEPFELSKKRSFIREQ